MYTLSAVLFSHGQQWRGWLQLLLMSSEVMSGIYAEAIYTSNSSSGGEVKEGPGVQGWALSHRTSQ